MRPVRSTDVLPLGYGYGSDADPSYPTDHIAAGEIIGTASLSSARQGRWQAAPTGYGCICRALGLALPPASGPVPEPEPRLGRNRRKSAADLVFLRDQAYTPVEHARVTRKGPATRLETPTVLEGYALHVRVIPEQ